MTKRQDQETMFSENLELDLNQLKNTPP